MRDYDNRIEELVECCQELADETPIPHAHLQFIVDRGDLVKVEGYVYFRSCRTTRRFLQWDRPALMGVAALERIVDLISPEFEQAITNLTGKFGGVEVEFDGGKITSVIIKVLFCRKHRRAMVR